MVSRIASKIDFFLLYLLNISETTFNNFGESGLNIGKNSLAAFLPIFFSCKETNDRYRLIMQVILVLYLHLLGVAWT